MSDGVRSYSAISQSQFGDEGVKALRAPEPDKFRIGMVVALLALASYPVVLASDYPPVGTDVGNVHPDFLLPKLDGTFGRLSDYRGQKVLLIHFASW